MISILFIRGISFEQSSDIRWGKVLEIRGNASKNKGIFYLSIHHETAI